MCSQCLRWHSSLQPHLNDGNLICLPVFAFQLNRDAQPQTAEKLPVVASNLMLSDAGLVEIWRSMKFDPNRCNIVHFARVTLVI